MKENQVVVGNYSPRLLEPQILSQEVAYELAAMSVKFSGFTAEQLEEAKKLATHKCLLIWGIEDVEQQADDDDIEISEDQAMMVLQKIKSDHDAGVGCNWDVVSSLISNIAG